MPGYALLTESRGSHFAWPVYRERLYTLPQMPVKTLCLR